MLEIKTEKQKVIHFKMIKLITSPKKPEVTSENGSLFTDPETPTKS